MNEIFTFLDDPQRSAEFAVYLGFSLAFCMGLFGFLWSSNLSKKS